VECGETYLEEEPFLIDADTHFNSDIVLYPMGHYKEPPFSIHAEFNIDQDVQLVYECVYNPFNGEWNIQLLNLPEKMIFTEVDYEAFTKVLSLRPMTEGQLLPKGSQEDTSKWHSVIPLETCTHCNEHVLNSEGIADAFKNNKCSVCNDSSENWYCLTCGGVFCSRYVKSHGLEHYNQTGHAILMSFSDLSSWCYLCDYYILDPSLRSSLFLLHLTKFGVPHPKDITGMFFSRFYCNICKKLIRETAYHCEDCEDYDMCIDCYNAGNFTESHTAEHNISTKSVNKKK